MKSIIAIVLLAAICIATIYADLVNFDSCMDPSQEPLFELKTIDVNPVSPSPGQNVTVVMSGFSRLLRLFQKLRILIFF